MNTENQKPTDSSKPQAQGRSRAQGSSKAARILIVDDEPNLLSGLSELLRISGYETETAGDGREALARIGRFKPVPGELLFRP